MIKKRTKSTNIPLSVKRKVYNRDGERCIFCGREGSPVAHFISRSRGGLGIESNILTLCGECHNLFDNGSPGIKESLRKRAKAYLNEIYPNIGDEERIYKKGE